MGQNGRLRTLIIEDNERVRNEIRQVLEGNADAVLIGETGSVSEATELIAALQPDLLLADVHLQDGNCFNILEQSQPVSCKIIFITGFEEFAIQAIKYGALDYIVKPFDTEDLEIALRRAKDAFPISPQQLRTAARHFHSDSAPPIIAVNEGHIWHVIDLDQVLYAQSADGALIHLQDGTAINTSKTISELWNMCGTADFVRPHASYMVSKRAVRHYNNRTHTLLLKNGIEIPVAPKRKETVITFLSNR